MCPVEERWPPFCTNGKADVAPQPHTWVFRRNGAAPWPRVGRLGRLVGMGYLIGTDEAGYGPNLGPLVISATVWEVPDGVGSEDLYRRLQAVIAPAAERNGNGERPRGDGRLEGPLPRPAEGCGCWSAACGRPSRCWVIRPRSAAEVWELLAPGSGAACGPEAGYCGDDLPLPLDAAAGELDALGPRLQAAFSAAGVRLLGVRSRAIFPASSMTFCKRAGRRACSCRGRRWAWRPRRSSPCPAGRSAVLCDKHGGRDRYLPLLDGMFSRTAGRDPRRGAAAERLSFRSRRAARGVPFPGQGRGAPAGGPGLDGRRSISASWRCGRGTTSGSAACRA